MGLTHVINVTKSVDNYHKSDIKYFRIPIEDEDKSNIEDYFDEAFNFICGALEENNSHKIFIHCSVGMSRSASIAIMYLMK